MLNTARRSMFQPPAVPVAPKQAAPAKRPILHLVPKAAPPLASVAKPAGPVPERKPAKASRKAAPGAPAKPGPSGRARRRLELRMALLAQLQAERLALFNPSSPAPLKIGIKQDMLDGGMPRQAVHGLLMWRTNRSQYRRAVAAGGPRYALDGSICGAVTAEEAAHAAANIAAKAGRKPPRASTQPREGQRMS